MTSEMSGGAPERTAGDGQPNILVLCMDQWDVHMDLPPGVDLPAIQRLVGAGVQSANEAVEIPSDQPRVLVQMPSLGMIFGQSGQERVPVFHVSQR